MAMIVMDWRCLQCGAQGEGAAGIQEHTSICWGVWPGEARDADLRDKVRNGEIPGRVPEHYAMDWAPRTPVAVPDDEC